MSLSRRSSEQLKRIQEEILSTPRRPYGWLARFLFFAMDLFYGRKGSLSKFKVLEIVARVPYQAWENVAYVAITHTHGDEDFAKRIFDRVQESRVQQDNEQWHLLILEELIFRKGIRENFFLYRIVPQFLAFAYYHITWILYVIHPRLSYQMNADFEDHAEHEYMEFVRDNPELENQAFESKFEEDYGEFDSLADLFRQIGYDEQVHKEESLERMKRPRFQ